MGRDDGPVTERPAHRVRMSRPFAIAKYETPQNLYQAVMGTNPSRWKGPRNAAEMMTWHEARTFCERITRILRDRKLIAADEHIRLPTEAEWEYCCRAGTTTLYSFGDSAQNDGDVGPKAGILDRYAWHTGNAAGNDPPVGALRPNKWGLFDMHGYLWEMTEDDWFPDYATGPSDDRPRKRRSERTDQANAPKAVNRSADPSSRRITIRGGSWRDRFDRLTSTARTAFPIDARSDAVGFRCVRSRRPPSRRTP
ncbi:MAG: formylglycine-generating enzyme family protein [Planctomycetota bacterium]|nr:MAG: formylglycine-generating enzyme family protein [Planctomycetota bacterium]